MAEDMEDSALVVRAFEYLVAHRGELCFYYDEQAWAEAWAEATTDAEGTIDAGPNGYGETDNGVDWEDAGGNGTERE